jgi:LPXTG-motif cell wall-anchored protein
MVGTNQGGSLLKFIVVSVAMAVILVGGIYVVRQSMTPQAPQPQPEQPSQPSNPPTGEKPPQDKPVTPPQQNPAIEVPRTGGPATLPQTGPAETFGSLLAIGLLSVAIASYLQSRRLKPSL